MVVVPGLFKIYKHHTQYGRKCQFFMSFIFVKFFLRERNLRNVNWDYQLKEEIISTVPGRKYRGLGIFCGAFKNQNSSLSEQLTIRSCLS